MLLTENNFPKNSEDSIEEKRELKRKAEELKNAAKEWLDYNRSILNAQLKFLENIQNKRGVNKLIKLNSANIKEINIDLFTEYLNS